MEKIATKQEFEEAYRKFSPSKFELFYIENMSIHSLRDDKYIYFIIIFICFLPFLTEVTFYLLDLSPILKAIPTFVYIFFLTLLGTCWSILWYKRHKRYEKIRKYLNISKEEYKNLVNVYFYNRYPNLEKYIEYNSKNK